MLKLGKLPDRTPIKLTIAVTPDLHRTLADYAAVYRETYGEKADIAELVPAMLEGFLASDRESGEMSARKPLPRRKQNIEMAFPAGGVVA